MGLRKWQICDAEGCPQKASHRVALTLEAGKVTVVVAARVCWTHRADNGGMLGSTVIGQTVDRRLYREDS